MKFSDLIIESKKQELTEKPMGFLKTMGNKVASTFGSDKATGRLETGKVANDLRKQFDIFLGKTGQNPTGDLVLQFLQQQGFPTKSAQNFIVAAGGNVGPVKTQAKTEPDVDPKTTPPTDDKTSTPVNKTPAPVNKDEIAKRVKANVGKTQAATKASNFGQQPEPAKPDAGAGAMAQFVKQQTGDNPVTMKPAPQKNAEPEQPAPAKQNDKFPGLLPGIDPIRANAANQKVGLPPIYTQNPDGSWRETTQAKGTWAGKTDGAAGMTSADKTANKEPAPQKQEPSGEKPGFLKTATDKIQDRAKNQEIDNIKAKPGFQRTATDKLKLKAAGVKESFESRLAFYLLLEEVLSGKQLDQIFLAAAQEKAKGGAGSSSDQAGNALTQPDQANKDKSKDSNFMKQVAAAYDGMRGAELGATKIGQEEPGKAMKDTSGRVPPEIMSQLNKLTNKQRAQLRKELDKA